MFQQVAAEEMAFAMALFVTAASGQLSAGRKPLTVKNRENGIQLFISLCFPNPGERKPKAIAQALQTELFSAFILVWEHYHDDPAQSSIGARLLGFYSLMVNSKGKALEPWATENASSDEFIELHPAVVQSLASINLAQGGRLDEKKFLSSVQALVPTYPRRTDPPRWPAHDGEMALLIQEHRWAATSLGPIAGWPQSLKTAVDLALACRFPMIVLWGKQLLQIYNMGYSSLMGDKHPIGLGQPTRECWPEVWYINEPIYARVQTGETVTFEDRLYPIRRHGRLEDAYFTLCYSPLRNEASEVSGILVTVFETTERVRA